MVLFKSAYYRRSVLLNMAFAYYHLKGWTTEKSVNGEWMPVFPFIYNLIYYYFSSTINSKL
jgi:hypothetical protein